MHRSLVLNWAVVWLCAFLAQAHAETSPSAITFQPDTDPPPVLCAPQVEKAPVLDGKLDDPAWQQAAVLSDLTTRGGAPAQTPTAVRVCFNREFLFVAFTCTEPRMADVVVTARAGEDKWPDNCVEVFVDPRRTKQTYYQLVTNHVDAHNDYGPGDDEKWNGAWTSKAAHSGSEWTTEIAIPFKDFGFDSAPVGAAWGFNVTRERVVSKAAGSQGELTTWALMGTFSSAHRYGVLYFGSAAEYDQRVEDINVLASLDRQVHTTLTPLAQVGVRFRSGVAKGSKVQVELRSAGADKPTWSQMFADLQSTWMGMDVPIQGCAPGKYEVRVTATDARGRSSNTVNLPLEIRQGEPAGPLSGRVPLRVAQAVPLGVDRWHVRAGVPFPEGVLSNPGNVRVLDRAGKPVDVQTEVLATWSKAGSIKWLGLDFQTPLNGIHSKDANNFTLEYGPATKAEAKPLVNVTETDKTITIDTGAAQFVVRKQGFNLFEQVTVNGKGLLQPGAANGPYMADEAGKKYWAAADAQSKVQVEMQGPLAAVVRAAGRHKSGDQTLGGYVIHIYFYGGTPYVRVQHTFIVTEDTDKTRYSDIGLLLPVIGEEFRMGIPSQTPTSQWPTYFSGEVSDHSVSLLQRRWDQFVIKENAPAPADRDANRRLFAGDYAPGWIARDDVALVVRDFWQNFPKELEATRGGLGGLIVHFWPGHGERYMDEAEDSSVDNAWRLGFAHQGKLLDFKIPKSYYNEEMSKEYGFAFPQADGTYKLEGGSGAKNSNAMGLGKTHDLLLAFGAAAQPATLTPLAEAFQAGVHVLPDPTWTCKSGALGFIHPYDPQRFPTQEDYYSTGFDYLMNSTLTLNHAYGMFNFGDSFTHFKTYTENQEPGYYRLWAGYHHGRARVPWLLYMRSGDPKYLTWARANEAHLADVDTVHFTTPEFSTTANDSANKLVGAMNDYKGFVHWHTGSRTGEYNSQMDFLMFDFYLTGDRRAWDVLQTAGICSLQRGHAAPERHGAGAISSWLDYYKATWDATAVIKIHEGLERMYSKPAREHSPPSIAWAPYLEPYVEMTGDAKARQFLMDFADWRIENPKTRIPGGGTLGGDTRTLSYATRLTGDPKYLLNAWSTLNAEPTMFRHPGDSLSGAVDWLVYSYRTQHSLFALAELARLPKPPELASVPYWMESSGPAALYHKPGQVLTLEFPEAADTAFTVGGRFGQYQDVQYRWLDPRGQVARAGILEIKKYREAGDSFQFLIEQPADQMTGAYRLEMESPRAFHFWTSNLSTLHTERFLIPPPQSDRALGVSGWARWFFWVPPDCEEFKILLRYNPDVRTRAVVAVMSPDDRQYRQAALPLGAPDQWLTVEPPRKWRNQVWSLAASQAVILDTQGIPKWFAGKVEGAALGATAP